MTWTLETSRGYESAKIRHLVMPYAYGRGLDIGCGDELCLPHMIGVDPHGQAATLADDGKTLDLIADGSLDFIFSSHFLEHVPWEEVPDVLALWWSKIRVGGHLILYLPHRDHYPRMGEEGANPDHKWDPGDDHVERLMVSRLPGWARLEHEVRSQGDEYSLFEVYRKDDWQWCALSEYHPPAQPCALVFRSGAIGDALIAGTVLPGLKRQGYHVTVSTNPVGEEALRHNPHIDAFIVHDQKMLPGSWIPEYLERMRERYDHIVNLDGSIESYSLCRPQDTAFNYRLEARQRLMDNVNYFDTARIIAGTEDHPPDDAFHPSAEEREWAEGGKASARGQPIILWAIAGSSPHKVYPWVDVVCRWLVADGYLIAFTGGPGVSEVIEQAIAATMYQDGVDMTRVHRRTGVWSLRQSLTFARIAADVVVGPETGVLNSVAFTPDMPKVIYLSHSSHQNLTRDWRATTVLAPSVEDCPCYPCHRIHHGFDTCHEVEETHAALCASSISPETLYHAITAVAPRLAKPHVAFDAPAEACEQNVE